jgi:hypothetical protein
MRLAEPDAELVERAIVKVLEIECWSPACEYEIS